MSSYGSSQYGKCASLDRALEAYRKKHGVDACKPVNIHYMHEMLSPKAKCNKSDIVAYLASEGIAMDTSPIRTRPLSIPCIPVNWKPSFRNLSKEFENTAIKSSHVVPEKKMEQKEEEEKEKAVEPELVNSMRSRFMQTMQAKLASINSPNNPIKSYFNPRKRPEPYSSLPAEVMVKDEKTHISPPEAEQKTPEHAIDSSGSSDLVASPDSSEITKPSSKESSCSKILQPLEITKRAQSETSELRQLPKRVTKNALTPKRAASETPQIVRSEKPTKNSRKEPIEAESVSVPVQVESVEKAGTEVSHGSATAVVRSSQRIRRVTQKAAPFEKSTAANETSLCPIASVTVSKRTKRGPVASEGEKVSKQLTPPEKRGSSAPVGVTPRSSRRLLNKMSKSTSSLKLVEGAVAESQQPESEFPETWQSENGLDESAQSTEPESSPSQKGETSNSQDDIYGNSKCHDESVPSLEENGEIAEEGDLTFPENLVLPQNETPAKQEYKQSLLEAALTTIQSFPSDGSPRNDLRSSQSFDSTFASVESSPPLSWHSSGSQPHVAQEEHSPATLQIEQINDSDEEGQEVNEVMKGNLPSEETFEKDFSETASIENEPLRNACEAIAEENSQDLPDGEKGESEGNDEIQELKTDRNNDFQECKKLESADIDDGKEQKKGGSDREVLAADSHVVGENDVKPMRVSKRPKKSSYKIFLSTPSREPVKPREEAKTPTPPKKPKLEEVKTISPPASVSETEKPVKKAAKGKDRSSKKNVEVLEFLVSGRSARAIKPKKMFDPSDLESQSKRKRRNMEQSSSTDTPPIKKEPLKPKIEASNGADQGKPAPSPPDIMYCAMCNVNVEEKAGRYGKLVCQECRRVAVHEACVRMHRTPFTCAKCRKCTMCNNKNEPKNSMIECRVCKDPYHIRCVGVIKVTSTWDCVSCSNVFEMKKLDRLGYDSWGNAKLMVGDSPPPSDEEEKDGFCDDKEPVNVRAPSPNSALVPDCSQWTAEEIYNYVNTYVPGDHISRVFLEKKINGLRLLRMNRKNILYDLLKGFKLGPRMQVFVTITRLQNRSWDITKAWQL